MKWNPVPLSEVVNIVINLIDQPERSLVVDGGELFDIFYLVSFAPFSNFKKWVVYMTRTLHCTIRR